MIKTWKNGMKKLDIIYPNKKFGGVYALGPLIINHIANSKSDWYSKRVYLDSGKIDADLIAVSLQYEPDLENLKEMLKDAGISLDKDKREQVIFAGGQVVSANPEIFLDLFDFVVVGDIEPVLHDILDKYDSSEFDFSGIVHSGKDIKLDVNDYPTYQPIGDVDSKFVFGKTFLLEIERGCPYRCKFCTVPGMFGNVRYRSLEDIKYLIDEGIRLNDPETIGILSFSMTHPDRYEILEYIISKDVRLSMPSLNVSTTDEKLLTLIRKGGKNSITFAVESDEKTRRRLGKGFSDEEVFEKSKKALELGFGHVKYYVILGLPEQENLDSLKEFILGLQKATGNRMKLSINPFVPKKLSLYKDEKFDYSKSKKEMKEMKEFLRQKNVSFKMKSLGISKREYQTSYR